MCFGGFRTKKTGLDGDVVTAGPAGVFLFHPSYAFIVFCFYFHIFPVSEDGAETWRRTN